MILLRSQILGFGRLVSCTMAFQNGLNLIFAPNEGGKSTLQRFLVGLLYGQLRSDLRVQRRLDPWVDQYKPWHGSEYGGILWCRLADGREMELHRYFGKDEARIEIRTATGEDVTRQYEQQRNGEVLFAYSHLGMPKSLFESVGVIRENKVAEIDGHETIRDRIANLAQSGDEDLSIRLSLSRIQEKLDFIGSERAPTKPYRQALDLVQSLQAEQREVEARRIQFQDWIEERKRLAGESARLEIGLAKARAALLSARRREVDAKVQSLQEIEKELSDLRQTIESLGARADFPADQLEEMNRLAGAYDSTLKHLNEVRSDKDAALEQLSQAESERKVLDAYGDFASTPEAEKVTEWFVSYLGLSLQKDGLQKTMNRLREQARILEERLAELSPALADPDADWERLAREAVEEEQNASQNCATLAIKMAQERSSAAAEERKAFNRRMLAGVAVVLGIIPLGARFLMGLGWVPSLYSSVFGLACAAVAAYLLNAASKSAGIASNSKQMLRQLEKELKDVREEGGKKRAAFIAVMKDSGFEKLEDFLAAAKQSEQDRQKLTEIQNRLAESEQQRVRLQAQTDETYQWIKDSLARVNLSCSAGNLKFQIDLLRSNLRRFRELDAAYRTCAQRAKSLASEDTALTDELNRISARMRFLLDQAQVETPEKFREECLKRQKLIELLDRESSRAREFQRLAGNLTLLQWKEKLQELMELPMPQIAESRSENPEDAAPYLPYLPTIAEAEEQEKEIAAQLSSAREEYARAMERTRHAFQGLRPSSEIEEDLAIAEQSFQGLETNRLALGIALETLEELSRQQQEVLAPQLNAAVEQRFLRLCNHRYQEVKIDPDFQVWAREADTGELRLAEQLSRGTQDQIYFSVRFGILDIVSKAEEPCPSLLDEPFAAYDHTRLVEAFDVLQMEAERRQLILFTCREDLLDLARRQRANVIRLDDH